MLCDIDINCHFVLEFTKIPPPLLPIHFDMCDCSDARASRWIYIVAEVAPHGKVDCAPDGIHPVGNPI